MLWLGIAATVGANVAYGARFGLLGAVISAWPAVAFIGAVEMVMQLVRRSRGPRRAAGMARVAGNVEDALRAAYAASVAAGSPLSQRAMAERFGLSRRKVGQLITPTIVQGNRSRPQFGWVGASMSIVTVTRTAFAGGRPRTKGHCCSCIAGTDRLRG
jgi:hypothetical protein